jgi:hypothetical protein
MSPLVKPGNHCSQCGAELQRGVTRCWLCSCNYEANKSHTQLPGAIAQHEYWHDRYPILFTLAWLLSVAAVIAVLLGAWLIAPGLAILLTVVIVLSAVPAMIRAQVLSSNAQNSSEPATTNAFIISFAITALAVTTGLIPATMVAIIAAFVSCQIVGTAPRERIETAQRLLVAAPIIGIAVTGLILWLTWPRKK